MPRSASHENKSKIIAILFVAIFTASGYFIYTLYTENQEQARTILEQAQSILQKSQRITILEGTVENQSFVISNQSSEIFGLKRDLRTLGEQVVDLSNKLGIAVQEVTELTPKIRKYYVVGVKQDGEGIVVPIEVKIAKGNGAISANINKVELLSGAQDSIRTAAFVASDRAGAPISDKDITVSFVHEGDEIVSVDGGSAGAAITLAIVATLRDEDPDAGVLMTGTILPSGAIGLIGSVEAKARAAMNFGAHTFLVPSSQVVVVSGISVVGVSSIDDAINLVL